MSKDETSPEKKSTKDYKQLKKFGIPIVASLSGLLILIGGFFGYLYASTPSYIRNPAYDHYHIRTQIIVDGKPIDFTTNDFQEEYDAGSCSADIPELPVDFHDGEDQLTHVHWSGLTGGDLLKYYGWNLVGGDDNSLGRRYDMGMIRMKNVSTRTNAFPRVADDTNFYIYVGDENAYEQKDWNNFLEMDLEEFFGTNSYLNKSESSFNIFDLLTGKASAHGDVEDEHSEAPAGEDEEGRLSRLNNLIGNMVIFAQNEEPTDEQIKEKFSNLTPLHDSTCGG